MQAASMNGQLAVNSASLDALRGTAAKDPKGAIREAAKQFEALFMQELMKSMRATTMDSGMLNNSGTELGTSMLDQQYAVQMSGRSGGLADAIARQLERQMGVSGLPAGAPVPGSKEALSAAMAARSQASSLDRLSLGLAESGRPEVSLPRIEVPDPGPAVSSTAPALRGAEPVRTGRGGAAQNFVDQHSQAAVNVAAESGIPAKFMIAQAAHETGWGRKEIRGADGTNSHNLFGIKAGAGWNGPTVTITTTEVYNGRAQKVQAKFRAYDSYEDSFRDYARLISTSPRYAGVMQAGTDAQAFARGLQRAGYATDPAYAQKLGRIIQTTERLQQAPVASQGAAGLNT